MFAKNFKELTDAGREAKQFYYSRLSDWRAKYFRKPENGNETAIRHKSGKELAIMTTPYSPDPAIVSKEDVETFADACCFLRASYWHFHTLFEKGDVRTKLLSTTAPIFFGDISQMLKEYLVLQICRLTDAEEMRGDKNLTVSFFATHSDFSATPKEAASIGELSSSIHDFRKLLLPARHKIISHNDRAAALDGKPLGAAPKEAWEKFWQDLREFVQIIHGRYVEPGKGLDIDSIHGLTDADDLVFALKQSTYFTTTMRDAEVLERCLDVAEGSEYFGA